MSLRAIKERARRDLHRAMQVPAFYYPGGSPVVDPVLCNVRVHTKFGARMGDLAGTNFNYAETEAQVPSLIFWLPEIDPSNNAVVVISESEGYRINHVHPRDLWSRKAEVSELDADELAAYRHP